MGRTRCLRLTRCRRRRRIGRWVGERKQKGKYLDDDGEVGELDGRVDEDDGKKALDRFGLDKVLWRLHLNVLLGLGRGDDCGRFGEEALGLVGADGGKLLAVVDCVIVGVPDGSVVARVIDGDDLGRLGQPGEELLVQVVVADKGEILCDPALVVAVLLVARRVLLLRAVARVGNEDDGLGDGVGPGEEVFEFLLNVGRGGGARDLGELGAVREPANRRGREAGLGGQDVVPALGVVDGALEKVGRACVGGRDEQRARAWLGRVMLAHGLLDAMFEELRGFHLDRERRELA